MRNSSKYLHYFITLNYSILTFFFVDYWFGSSEILELSPRNVTIKEGNSVNISCVARFEMDPWFSWVRRVASNKTENGKVFFHSGTSSYYEVSFMQINAYIHLLMIILNMKCFIIGIEKYACKGKR